MPPVQPRQVVVAVLAFVAFAAASPASALAGVSITLESTGDGQHYAVGAQATATVTYTDGSNAPVVGAVLNFTRSGANSGSGTAPATDVNGQTTISWNGTNAGDDTLTVWDDSLGSSPGVPDGGEPQGSAFATFWYGGVQVSSGGPALTGAPVTFHAFVTGENGAAVGAGETVTWAATGANPDSGTATTDASGMATIMLNGTVAGSSSLAATWDNPSTSSNDPTDSTSFFWYASIQVPSSAAITGVTVGPDLWCQATYNGDTSPEFFGHFPGSCGTYVRGGGSTYGPGSYTPVSQPTVTGTGVTGDPYTLTTTVNLPSLNLAITTITTYVVGEDTYRTDVTVTDQSGAPQNVSLFQYADCYLGNSDSGYGYLDPSSGGVFCTKTPNNSPADRLEGFIPLNTGFTRMEGGYSEVSAWMFGHDTFPGTCDCTIPSPEDNGMGLSWQLSLPANGSATRSFLTGFSPVGTVPGGNGSGDPPPSGGGGGGGGGGSSEPTATTPQLAAASQSPSQGAPQQQPQQQQVPPPVGQTSGNLLPESGTVLVRVPGSLRYVSVEQLTSIPVGSLIDARKGVVLLTVSDGLGHFFTGEFRGGLFRFSQRLARKGSKKLITDITLAGGKFASLCGTGTSTKGKARAASWADASRRRVVRYLNAKANGSFNVVGRDAAGLERGTEWKTIDTCDSTEVHVIDGTVLVTDLVLDRTVTVKKGKTYIAHDRPTQKKRRR